ncbi:MAG: RluA family pseudouridine synthase [Burkholderiaceae bacterium]|nr:RluA family pseudouridine synthase [Burkholderiaceae bacterium]
MLPCPHLKLLHADASLIVAEKPAGGLAVPGRGEAGRDNLAARVQARFADALSMAFARGEVFKQYVAVVEGDVQGESGSIAASLAADWPNRPRQVVDPVRGKPSLTRWRVLSRGDGQTRLELEPLTGRTHQLRVHLQWIGHPIRGDALYASVPLCAERLLLHACRLAFVHPFSGAPCSFESAPDF